MFPQLTDAMRAVGLAPTKELHLRGDGRLVRYRVEGDKSGSKNGWVSLHDGDPTYANFGSWKTGATHHWRENMGQPLDHAKQIELNRRMAAAAAARAEAEARYHDRAVEKFTRLWQSANPATSHPYLERKGVHAYGLRVQRDQLLIPARDNKGQMHGLQTINPDGSKQFMTGSRYQGCYFAIGRPDGVILVAEGYATAATLHEATGHAVAVCFSAGNMTRTASALRNKFPDATLVLCADNDAQTPGNPGLAAALAAADAVGGRVCIPTLEVQHE